MQWGIEEVRLTGDEPLRRGVVEPVARLAALEPRPSLSMTTNALARSRLAPALAAAGLERVNVSLDTLRADRFREFTRRDGLEGVLEAVAAGHAAGLRRVKLNAVLQRGVNDDEVLDLLGFALADGYELRFIVSMPLEGDHRWRREDIVDQVEILLAAVVARPRAAGGARERAGDALAGGRRPHDGRHPRLGDPALLRPVGPVASHRRRPDPHLPVSPARRPTYGPRCATARPTPSSGACWPAPSPTRPRGTASASPGSRRLTAPCPPSAADRISVAAGPRREGALS